MNDIVIEHYSTICEEAVRLATVADAQIKINKKDFPDEKRIICYLTNMIGM